MFKARVGVENAETPREISFCAHAIAEDGPLLVEDATLDPRFAHNPLVTGDPFIRFYAGVPLTVASGHRLGTLCVIAPTPRRITPGELAQLTALAAIATDEMELSRQMAVAARAQTKTQDVLDAVSTGFGAIDAAGRITHVNATTEALLNRSRADLVGRFWEDLYPGADLALFHSEFARALREGTPGRIEGYAEPLDRWFEVRTFPFEDGLSIYYDDITEGRQLRLELAERDQLYRGLLAATASTVWRLRPHGVTQMDLRKAEDTEMHTRGLTGDGWLDLVHPEDRPEVARAWAEAQRAQTMLDVEFRSRQADGSYPWRHVRSIPVRDAAGNVSEWIAASDDISARKEAEAKVLTSEARFRSLFQNASEAITLLDANGTVLYVSTSTRQVTGYTPEQRVGRLAASGVHPDDVARINDAFRAVLEGQSGLSVEYRFRHASGQWRWFESLATNMLADPNVGAVVLNTRDVTDRVLARQAIEESEQRYRLLADHTGQLLYEVELETGTIQWSGNIKGVTGLTPVEIAGVDMVGWAARVHPDDAARTEAVFNETVRARGSSMARYRFRHADGTYRHIEALGVMLPASAGQGPRLAGTMADVTERIWNADLVRTSERRYRALSKLVKSFAFSFELPADGTAPTLEWITGSVETVMGGTAEALEGRTWQDLFGVYDRDGAEALLTELRGGVEQVYEVQMPGLDGKARWIRLNVQPEVDAETGRVVRLHGAGKDVTVYKEAEEALVLAREQAEQARSRAEEMARLKDAFLANMSHEIRTPLTAILGFTELLQDVVDEEGREYVHMIEMGGRRLKETLTSVLELSQLQAGHTDLRPTPLDVGAVVQETIYLLQGLAAEQGVTLHIAPVATPIRANLDRTAFERILSNLIGNGIKFTPKGGTVTVTPALHEDLVTLTITDTGIGISDGFLPHLFEDFRQESLGLSRTHEGNGLGLTITKRLVELMGGTIEVTSQRRVGTTFTVRLPNGLPPVAPRALPVYAETERTGRVLLVEDESHIRLFVSHALRGYTVIPAESADAAIALVAAAEVPFDAVLLDINLGAARSGEELLPVLQATTACAGAEFLAVTAYALPGDREHFLAVGFDGYLAKPFTRAELMEALAPRQSPP